MLNFAQKYLLCATLAVALCACATTGQQVEDAVAKVTAEYEEAIAEEFVSSQYAALYTPGNEFNSVKSVVPESLNQYEHYALLKVPGSIYDNSRYSIEFYRDFYTLEDEEPRYWAAVHFTSPWDIEKDDENGAKAKREIHGQRLGLSEAEFASIRSNLAVEAFVAAGKNADDGTYTTHLDLYTFDLTRNGKRDIVSVGWEGFDRFGDAAETRNVFMEVALNLFPDFAASGLATSSAPSSSTQEIN